MTVRMAGLSPLVDTFETPKCKFGLNSMIVDATYVKCTMKQAGFYDKEAKSASEGLNATCIQCESSPPSSEAEIISFTVSLTGNFDDAESSMPYRYYNKL